MKEVSIIVFEAFDGQRFDSAVKCREHESVCLHLRLANLSPDQVKAALDRSDPDLADAFEKAGLAIRDARRKRGELKWSDARKKAQQQVQEDQAA